MLGGALGGEKKFICIHYVYKAVSLVIPVRVSKGVAKKIKELVDLGVYPSRSGLVREAVRRLLASEGLSWQRSLLGKAIANLASHIIAWNEESVSDIILFGSVARGEASVESDVDLLVLTENAEAWIIRRRLYDLVYPLVLAFGVDISLIVVEKARFTDMVKRKDPFATSILKEGVQLYGGLLVERGGGASK